MAFKRQKFESGPTTSERLFSQWLKQKYKSSLSLQGLLITPVIVGGSAWKETGHFPLQWWPLCSTVGQRGPGCFQVQFYILKNWTLSTDKLPVQPFENINVVCFSSFNMFLSFTKYSRRFHLWPDGIQFKLNDWF